MVPDTRLKGCQMSRPDPALPKDASRTIFNRACATRRDNLIKRSYRRCLANTGNDVHARLTCQRKILAIAWAMWRDDTAYDDNLDIRA